MCEVRAMMGRRLPARSGDEHDVVTRWRRVAKYLGKPGAASSIKRRMRRRERHEMAAGKWVSWTCRHCGRVWISDERSTRACPACGGER